MIIINSYHMWALCPGALGPKSPGPFTLQPVTRLFSLHSTPPVFAHIGEILPSILPVLFLNGLHLNGYVLYVVLHSGYCVVYTGHKMLLIRMFTNCIAFRIQLGHWMYVPNPLRRLTNFSWIYCINGQIDNANDEGHLLRLHWWRKYVLWPRQG